MNERIRLLMTQAGTDTSGKWMGIDHAEKFAELIVRECARIVNENDCEGSIVGDGMLFEHFGVEE